VSAFDNLLVQSNSLLTTSDDLVSTLYTPQDPSSVRQETIALARVAAKLHSQVATFFSATNELEKQLNALEISAFTPAPTTQPSKKKADKKWFETCFDQIAKLCGTLSESLSRTDNPGGGSSCRKKGSH
jgi:hypothetical protein